MKAYAFDLRIRITAFVNSGGSKTDAAERFSVSLSSVYRYLGAHASGTLAPKRSWGSWRKLNPEDLRREVGQNSDATLEELAKPLGVHFNTVRYRLGKMGYTLKKTRALQRERRGATQTLP